MILSNTAIKRPVFTIMVVSAMVVLGFVSLFFLPNELFPDVAFPVVVVNTVYKGASSQEVETLVSKPVEEAVSSIGGIQKLISFSNEGLSTVMIEFTLETSIKLAAVDVREKISAIRESLPKDIDEPVIQRFDPSSAPILTYTISASKTPFEVRKIAEDDIKPKLEEVEGVASVEIIGGLEREIQIKVDLNKVKSLGISLSQIKDALASENLNVPAGHVSSGAQEFSIRTLGEYKKVKEIENSVISVKNGALILLKDIAEVSDTHKEIRTTARTDGKESVALLIRKQSGENTVATVDAVAKKIKKIEKEIASDVKISKIIDTSLRIRENLKDVTTTLIFGGFMAVLVIFVFMLDWRSTVISGLALPTSVISTFFFMFMMGFTINIMTLLSLSLAIGMLIDDAIVVRENIFRRMEAGEDAITAAQKGTEEIALAVMATTFTIVAVFVPVAFMSGLVGKFFKQFGLTVTAAVVISLFISFTLDPMLSAHIMKPVEKDHQKKIREHKVLGKFLLFFETIERYYLTILKWALENRKKVILASVLIFIFSLSLVYFVGKDFISHEDRGEFTLNIELPVDASFKENNKVSAEIEKILIENPEVRTVFTVVGKTGIVNKSLFRILTTRKNERNRDIWEIQQDIREKLKKIPAIKYDIEDIGPIEGGYEPPINLHLRGDDFNVLSKIADDIKRMVKETPGTADVKSSWEEGKPELQIIVNKKKAADLGLNLSSIAFALRGAIEGDVATRLRDGAKEYDIRVQLDEKFRNSAIIVDNISVQSVSGRMFALKEFSDILHTSGPARIERQSRQRQISISATLYGGKSLGEVLSSIEGKLKKIDFPRGYGYSFSGEAERLEETKNAMGLAILLAVIFIYMILASQYESFLHPFTIMLSLPLALIGAIFFLFVFNKTLGLPSMIGVIMLMGLVTKNGILLVDFANQLKEKGMNASERMLKAGPVRLRPILMTSMAMIIGMLPTAVMRGEGSEFRSPMALAIIGGLLTSTFLTLVVIPVVYTLVDKYAEKFDLNVKKTGGYNI